MDIGFLTPVLKLFVPIGGGGISLIFVLTIPVLAGLGILFSIMYHFFIKKIKSKHIKKVVFTIMLGVLIGLCFWFYPYDY